MSEIQPTEPLVVLQPSGGEVVDVVSCNAKSRTKTLERGELWIVDPATKRVLPFRGGGVVVGAHRSRTRWWEVVVAEAAGAPEARPTARVATGTASEGDPGDDTAAGARPDEGEAAGAVLATLGEVIARRRREMPEGSYTTHLFRQGPDKIRKKTGEEAVEVILARTTEELRGEAADLLYHLMVLLEVEGMRIEQVIEELAQRHRMG